MWPQERSGFSDSGTLQRPEKTRAKRWNFGFWKTWLLERFSEALTSKLWNKKNTCCQSLQRWSEMELCSPPYGFVKNYLRIYLRWNYLSKIYLTWNSREKIKSAIPREQICVAWLVKNGKTVFSNLTQKAFLSLSGEQASRGASTWPLIFLSQILDTSQTFRLSFLSGISTTFHFGPLFNGFLTSTFDLFWNLALQPSCIMIRLSESQFPFAVASN